MRIRNSSRRSFVKLLTAAPRPLSQIAARDLYAQAASRDRQGSAPECINQARREDGHQLSRHVDLFERVPEFPEVRQAQLEAADYFVNMLDLQRAVGRRLSELTGAGVRHHHVGFSGCNGGGDGCLHGRYR